MKSLPNLSGQVVFSALSNAQTAYLYNQMVKNGNVIIIGTDSISTRKEFLSIVNKGDNNKTKMRFINNWDKKLSGENIKDFLTTFHLGCTKQNNPTFLNGYSYDMGMLAIEWLKENSNARPVSSIRKTERTSVLNGQNFVFADSGFSRRNYVMYEYSGGNSAKFISK
ncbi:MAG: hypothetical protein KTR20_14485 [Cellvibrionaceae bacterium]|nr:hypothetical protein [Cellvibrionaceae bacterium]